MFKAASQRSPYGQIPTEFEVKTSGFLRSKGITSTGLYTARSWNKGDILGEYRGKRLNLADALKKKRNRNYMFDVKRGKKVLFVIDAANKHLSSFVRFANAADHVSQQNTEFVQRGEKIYLKALSRIPKGKEILAWYGNQTADVIRQK
jgi:hypothetical protein